MKTTVILLDVDIRSIEGVIASFGKRKVPVVGTSSISNPDAKYSKYVKKVIQSPSIENEKEYLEFLLNIDYRGVLVYSSDTAAEFVSKNKEILISSGFLINIPDYTDFKEGFEKDRLYHVCQEINIPTIKTCTVNSYEDLVGFWHEQGPPLLIKPTKLAGGLYKLIHKEEELQPIYQSMVDLVSSPENLHLKSKLIAQEFIIYNYDDIYCCETHYSSNKIPYGFLSIKKIRPNINRDGTPGSRLFAGVTVKEKTMEFHTKKLLDHLNWTGFAHLDWLYSAKYDDFLLCEINPRLPGFSNFLTKIDFDVAWDYYVDLTGGKPELPSYKKALYFEALRVPGDLSNSLYMIMKRKLDFLPFIKSYLRIFTFKYTVCLDPFYGSDVFFTLKIWQRTLVYLSKRINRKKSNL